MQNDILASLGRLSDADLVARVKSLVRRDQNLTAEIVAHIAELDTRDVHLREGYASLFVYCRDALGLSEWEAYNRIEVARAARRFPMILDLLAEGSVHLTSVRLLAPHLTADNHREVLESARWEEKARDRTDGRPSGAAAGRTDLHWAGQAAPVRFLAAGDRSFSCRARSGGASTRPSSGGDAPLPGPLQAASDDRRRNRREAAPGQGHAQPRHSVGRRRGAPGSRVLGAIGGAGEEEVRRHAPPPVVPRRPSARVRQAVWVRDLGRCAYVAPSGHRCTERRFVQFHHLDPYVLGGEATVDLIQLRCRPHNDYEGRLYFGKRRRSGELVPEQVGSSVTHPSP